MTTHIIQLSEKFEAYLQIQTGNGSSSMHSINAYIEYLLAKDMAENGSEIPSGIARLLTSPEVLKNLTSRYLDKESASIEIPGFCYLPAMEKVFG